MTALDKLNNYRAKFRSTLSARKISEPLVRALYWRQEYWMWLDVYRGAEKPSVIADIASDELANARAEYRLIIRRAWAMRVSEEDGGSMITRTFVEAGDFAAFAAAENMAANLGLSVGRMQRDQPIGLMHGDWDIQKWRNLSARDRDALHGVITGDKRNGPVSLSLNINCPQVIRDQLMALGGGYDNTPEPA